MLSTTGGDVTAPDFRLRAFDGDLSLHTRPIPGGWNSRAARKARADLKPESDHYWI